MLTTWYHSTFSGDFRLCATSSGTCVLVVQDPTPRERKLLAVVLERAREHGWTDKRRKVKPKGKTELAFTAPVNAMGAALYGRGGVLAMGDLLTIVSKGGQVVATWDNLEDAGPGTPGTDLERAKPQLPAKADQAVTVKKPRRGGGGGDCPESLASEVLHAFSSPAQWRDWEAYGMMVCHGGLTGRRYRLAHRKRHVRTGHQVSVAVALDDVGTFYRQHRSHRGPLPVNAFDFMVPPPEEVLALKLVLEHREDWLRNPGSMPDATEDLFEDPFPGEVAQVDAEMQGLAVLEQGVRGGLLGGMVGLAARHGRRG